MTLPNYFLADLPSEAALTPAMLTEACLTLKRNRESYLVRRSTDSMVHLLSEVAANWLNPDYPIRQLALERGTAELGFSTPILAAGLQAFFQQLTAEHLHALLQQDLGNVQRLDEFTADEGGRKSNRRAIATCPDLIVHITAGNIPVGGLMSMVLGVLLRSAQFVKCPSDSVLLPRLFAHSLYEAEPKLGACIEVAQWPGGNRSLEQPLFEAADVVTATGSDETLASIQQRLPSRTRFVGHGHRLSFAYISRESLRGIAVQKLVARTATDVIAWNQLGCLSPHVIYVETGGGCSPEDFAAMLADELQLTESDMPRGRLPAETAATIAARRGFYEVRAAHSKETLMWSSRDSTAWTVVFELDPRFQTSCLNRFIYVKPVSSLEEALHSADSVRGKVSTVGLAASDDLASELVVDLARWGVTRICPLGQMQNPPLTWRHDGRPSLGELVTWTDWEF